MPSLKERREGASLALFRNIAQNDSAVKLPSYVMKKTRNTRQNNTDFARFVYMQCSTESYKKRFFARTF